MYTCIWQYVLKYIKKCYWRSYFSTNFSKWSQNIFGIYDFPPI